MKTVFNINKNSLFQISLFLRKMSSSSEYNSPVELISQVVLSNDQLATLLDDVEFNSPLPRATTAVKRTADQDKPPRFKIPKIVRTEPDEVISERPIISPTPLNNRVPQPIKTSTPKPSAHFQSTDPKPIQATPAYYALTYRGAKLEYDRKIIKLATEDKLSVFDIWRYFAKQTNAKLTICDIKQLLRCAYCDQKHATTTECLMKFLSTTGYYVVNPKYQVIDFDRARKH